jgi:hypothetical protein
MTRKKTIAVTLIVTGSLIAGAVNTRFGEGLSLWQYFGMMFLAAGFAGPGFAMWRG